jgi:OHCU decarboxylase
MTAPRASPRPWPAPSAPPPTTPACRCSRPTPASAGLDLLTDEERETFTRLNDAYVAKHGHPFIIAVRDHDKQGILAAFETRLANDSDTEFATACAQVERIAELRLLDQLP